MYRILRADLVEGRGRRDELHRNRVDGLGLGRLDLLLGRLLSLLAFVLVVTFDVLGQVVRAHEAPLAHRADELLLAGVGALVAGQLVRPGEPAAAVGPLADEGPLAGVDALVGLQVARFEVVFATVGMLALVDSSPLGLLGGWDWGGLSEGLLGLVLY